jgi:soluble lytic murein transglycosylase
LAGKSEERKRNWSAAAGHYLSIPELYPDSSFADDGYSLGGTALFEAGDEPAANAAWESQLELYPAGDMAGETAWRVAWSRYQAGDTAGAISSVDTTLVNLPIDVDRDHFIGARYWSARWRGWPDVANPTVFNPIEGVDKTMLWGLLKEICLEHSTSIYAVLATMRMRELIETSDANETELTEEHLQEVLSQIGRPSGSSTPAIWRVRESFANDPALVRGVALTRLGLFTEGLTELSTLGRDELLPMEALYIERIRSAAGDEISAHDFLRKYLQANPPEQLGESQLEFLSAAYPNRYWREINEATDNYDWNPRVFHSLVREESNFNPRIVSWAGARGLSQLMPRTAQSVAGWLSIPYSRARLFEPAYNLAIGSRYIDHLMGRYGDSPFLALAGYNAGEGNVGRWLRRFGDIPTDEMVESIPIRQTRHYVKRVMSSFQTYNMLYDGGETILDLHRYVHHAVPSN